MIWEPANRAETNGCSVVDNTVAVLYYANGHFERWQKAGRAHLKTSTGIIKQNTKGRTGFFIRISWRIFQKVLLIINVSYHNYNLRLLAWSFILFPERHDPPHHTYICHQLDYKWVLQVIIRQQKTKRERCRGSDKVISGKKLVSMSTHSTTPCFLCA